MCAEESCIQVSILKAAYLFCHSLHRVINHLQCF